MTFSFSAVAWLDLDLLMQLLFHPLLFPEKIITFLNIYLQRWNPLWSKLTNFTTSSGTRARDLHSEGKWAISVWPYRCILFALFVRGGWVSYFFKETKTLQSYKRKQRDEYGTDCQSCTSPSSGRRFYGKLWEKWNLLYGDKVNECGLITWWTTRRMERLIV